MASGTKQILLEEVRALLIEQGYQATSLADIMKATDLSKGAIYHHFPHKEAIALEILRADTAHLTALIKHSGSLEVAENVKLLLSQSASSSLVVWTLAHEMAGHAGRLADEVRHLLEIIKSDLVRQGDRHGLVFCAMVVAHALLRLGEQRSWDRAAALIIPAMRSDEDGVDIP
ncbi:MAG: helix-turn-helix domain-containing protein [Saprospiraceae bacterium]|nr:helix-turn-helix domain-containing protein [Saprospiraceae bacterium]